jgi:hypothetical protein
MARTLHQSPAKPTAISDGKLGLNAGRSKALFAGRAAVRGCEQDTDELAGRRLSATT